MIGFPGKTGLVSTNLRRRLLALLAVWGVGIGLLAPGIVAAEGALPIIVYGDERLPPYEFIEDGVPKGIHVDLWRAIGRILERPIDIRLTDWGQAQTNVRTGTGDALSFLSRTPERETLYGFSQTTSRISFSLFVRTGDAARFETMPLSARRVGVVNAGLPRVYFETNHPDVSLIPVSDTIEGMRRLLRGDIDAFAAATWTGDYFLRELNISGVTPLPQPFAVREGGGAVRLSNRDLLTGIDQALTRLKSDGTFDRIIDRWTSERVHIFSERDIELTIVAGGAGIIILILFGFLLFSRIKQRALAREVAERRQAEAELKQERQQLQATERKLKTLTNRLTLATLSGRIGVWEWDIASGQIVWDARMLELYGVDPGGAAPGYAGWRERCHPDDIVRAEAEIAATLAGIAPFNTEFRIVTPAGHVRTIKAAGLVERDAAGQPVVMIGVNWDISADRDSELALEAARHRAEDANRAKSEFLSNMSHEIRTPMNAIMGLIYLIGQSELSPAQRDYLEKVEVSAKSLLDILSNILDISKIEAGRLELEQAPFQLDELMKVMATVAAANARDKDIEVLFHIAPGTPVSLVGDPLRLQQILSNLADNAIKFTHCGEVTLSVSAEQGEGDTVGLTFEVRDTGIGIATDKLESIFEVFSQGDASTTRRYGGSGLGLAICKRLAALMNGDIRVDSAVGRGSSFRFTARFGRGPELGMRVAPTSAPIRPLRVLVVDDNPTACEIMASMIAPFGWDAEISRSGGEALLAIDRTLAKGSPFDLILLDWRMPDVSGQDVLCYARERYHPAAMPAILVVTAYERDLVRQEAGNDASIKTILTKPITPSVLLDAVTGACSPTMGLPAALSPTPTSESESASASANAKRLTGITLLLVEDNAINQLVARHVLESVGSRVEVACGGAEAVQLLKASPTRFDAVLMDVQMPDMDGFEATRIIRQTLGLTHLPIIAVTANAMQADREHCLAVGMNAHLAKPINPQALFATLSAALPMKTPTAPPRFSRLPKKIPGRRLPASTARKRPSVWLVTVSYTRFCSAS